VASGFPLWSMTVTYNNLILPEAGELKAWVDSLRGPQRLIYAYDLDRQIPLWHQGGRPFAASPATWAQTIDGDGLAHLALTGLLPGQVVSIGDYVGFAWGTAKYTAVRSLEYVVADASGSASFVVEPPVPTLVVPPEAITTLRQAGCLMRLVTGDTKLNDVGLGFMASGAKISAVQDLIP
jgi:hypothetical protein